jgi:uncharacterized phiE125 gp8 family phage protein
VAVRAAQVNSQPGNPEEIMSAILLTPPAAEPLSLGEVKEFLRVEHDADDELIASLTASARGEVELATRRVLVTQTWRIVLHRWPPSGRIVSPASPLRTLEAARVFDADGAADELDSGAFLLDTSSVPGVIAFARTSLPAPGRALAGIALNVTAGYGEAADIPAPLLHAIRLLLARAYEQRDRVAPDALPDTVMNLIAPFRVVSL